jgi:hypothetical protein
MCGGEILQAARTITSLMLILIEIKAFWMWMTFYKSIVNAKLVVDKACLQWLSTVYQDCLDA